MDHFTLNEILNWQKIMKIWIFLPIIKYWKKWTLPQRKKKSTSPIGYLELWYNTGLEKDLVLILNGVGSSKRFRTPS